MKRSIINLLASILLLGLGWLVPHSVFSVSLETAPTPPPTPTLIPLPGMGSPTPEILTNETIQLEPTVIATDTPVEDSDPYGELYFTVIVPDTSQQTDPSILIDEFITRLVRLPGSCVVGLVTCPDPEIVPTPFNMQAVLATDYDSGAPIWSPDGRYGLLVIHPEDDFSRGWTAEEWEQFKARKLEDLTISASTLYLFDAETDTWHELYRADRKFFYSARWSPDGQWIAFTVASSMVNIHPSQADDGVYVVHPDGSGLQRLVGNGGYALGWVGNSILLRRFLNPGPEDFSHVVELLTLDGQVTKLFESSRLASYALAPDGGSLLAADGATRDGGSPLKTINVLALDGSVIRSFGTFSNRTSAIAPFVWSPDGSQVAMASLRRAYVAPRLSQVDIPTDAVGVPPETREVYAASDEFIEPSFFDFEFSHDNKYLVMEVYEGFTYFVVVALDTGQARPLAIPHLDPFVVDNNYLGDIGFFSWRQ